MKSLAIAFRGILLVGRASSMLFKVLAQKGKNHDPQTQSPPRLTLLDAQKGYASSEPSRGTWALRAWS